MSVKDNADADTFNAATLTLRGIEDPSKRRFMFCALLSKEVSRLTGQMPVIVGGEAVEIYTQGGYTTGDIDVKAPLNELKAVLKDFGFTKVGRTWSRKDLDIYIEWVGGALDEGPEAEKRTNIIFNGDYAVRVISIEDLIIDRLNAAKWWRDSDSETWARALFAIGKNIGIDENYLARMAEKNEVEDKLSLIVKPAMPKGRRR